MVLFLRVLMSTVIGIVSFIFVILILPLGLHYWLYASIVRFCGISGPAARKAFLGTLTFLALSFLPSVILLRFHWNFLTRFFYQVACLWLGLFLYLLMALILLWAFYGAARLVGKLPDMKTLTAVLILTAVAVSSYGFWKARHPVLTRIDVKIEGLPKQWRHKTIVQLSDVHLGVFQGTGFFRKIAKRVNGLNPELILITGDLFDGMGGGWSSFIPLFNSLEAANGVFFVTGNHEGYLGLKEPLEILERTKIRVLDNESVDVQGLQIVGIPFPEHGNDNEAVALLAGRSSYDPNKPAVLMYHTPTDIAGTQTDRPSQQSSTYWFQDTNITLAKKAGIDLQLSGHTHQGQLFPFGYLTRMIYAGRDYGLHKDGNFQLYVSSGTGTWGPPFRTSGVSEIVAIELQ
jgi:predicted MPP superfamily phosphohydrolase